MATESTNRNYPAFTISHIQNPNRFYAVPLLGFLVKIIILIPQFLWLFGLGIAFGVASFINSFSVTFNGKYLDSTHDYSLRYMRLHAKVYLFFAGLTNKYPGFTTKIEDNFTLDMPKPMNPNKLYAIPIAGGVIRIILLVPFFIYLNILSSAAQLAVFFSALPVLFVGKYPESTYELIRDSMHRELGVIAYFAGLSDTYPSFRISLNHKAIKIALLVGGVVLFILNSTPKSQTPTRTSGPIQDQNFTPPYR